MFVSFRSLRQPHHSNLSACSDAWMSVVLFSGFGWWVCYRGKQSRRKNKEKGGKARQSELFPFLALSLAAVLWCEGRLRSLVPALMDSH